MLRLLLLPVRIVWGIVQGAFGIVWGVFSGVLGLVGGIVSLILHLLAVGLIVGLLIVVFRRRTKDNADDNFVSFYDQHP